MNAEYKQTEIGRIPKEWEVVKLGDCAIAKIRGNKTFNGFDKVVFIPMEFISDSRIFVDYEIRPIKEVKSFTYCEKGDLLLAKITPSLENGKQGIVPDDILNGFALATTEIFPISCKGIDRLFLFYILKFSKFRNKIISSMIGTTGRQRASKESVERLYLPLPPLPEQKKIAEILSTADEAIVKVDDAISKTYRLKKGLMQELLTKGIGHREFKEIRGMRSIPSSWKLAKLQEIVLTIKRGPFGGSIKKEFFVPKGYKVYEQKNVIYNNFDLGNYYVDEKKYNELRSFAVSKDDILLTGAGTIGKVVIVPKGFTPGVINQALIKISLDKEKILVPFFYNLIGYEPFRKKISGSSHGATMKNISSIRDLKSIKIPLPPLPEQKKIAEILTAVDERVELLREKKKRLEKIKQGLMNDLLTGRKRVKV